MAELVGRDVELAALDEALTAARVGRVQVVFIEGPAGIGKSRLLAEAAARAGRVGAEIVAGRCEELGATRSFGVLADALGCMRDAADEQRRRIGQALADDAGQRSAFGSGAEQFRLAEDFVDLAESLAVLGPVMLTIDDLQWADPSTLYTLRLLMRRLADLPVLLAAALRPLPRPPELRQLVDHAIDKGARALALAPLARGDVAQLAAVRLGAEPGTQLARFLDGAGGNPLFVGEVIDGLVADGAVVSSAGVAELVRHALPPDLRLTILRRIAYLSDEALRLLRLAAVLGQTVFPSDLAVVTRLALLDVLGVIEEWTAAGLVVVEGDAYAFRHDVIREALHDDMSRPLRTALRLDAARALRAAGAPVTRVAQHYSLAASRGDDEAVEVLREAAAASSRAPTTRAALLERAADLVGEDAPERDQLLVELADALVWAGRHDDGQRLAGQLLERGLVPPFRRRARLTVAYTLLTQLRREELIASTSRWLGEGVEDESEQAMLEIHRAWAYIASHKFDDAPTADVERALAVGQRHGDDALTVLALLAGMFLALYEFRFSAATEYGLRAVELADRSRDPRVQRLNPHVSTAAVLQYAGRFDECEQILEAGARLREATGAAWSLPAQLANTAIIYHVRGRLDDAAAAAEAALDAADVYGVPMGIEQAHNVLAAIAVWRGDFDAAERHIRGAEKALLSVGGTGALTIGMAVRLQLARGDVASARPGIMRELRSRMAYAAPFFAVEVVPVLMKEGESDLARQVVEWVEGLTAGKRFYSDVFVAAARAMVDDDPDALASSAGRCLDSGLFRGTFAAEYAATVLATHGRVGEADAVFKQVLQRYDDAGASWLTARVHAQMRALGLRPAIRRTRRKATSGWDALTDAERTVAGLAADGLTNPQIAQRLVVSRYTVQTHMSNALAKLGLSSRVQLAAAVARAAAARDASEISLR